MKIENLSFGYQQNRIINDVNCDIEEGKFISLIGPNGSGKSTMLKLICGILEKEQGDIFYKDQNIEDINILDRAKEITAIHQREKNEFPFSCMDTVIMGLHPHRNRFEPINDDQLALIEEIMIKTDTLQFADKLITEISGGELQRVILARALVQQPKLLLMDEAMSDMDVNAKINLTKLVKEMVDEKGVTVLAVNHDLNLAYKFSDQIIAVNNGTIDSTGDPDSVMNEDFFERVFKVKADIIKGKGFFIHDNIDEQ